MKMYLFYICIEVYMEMDIGVDEKFSVMVKIHLHFDPTTEQATKKKRKRSE